MLVARAHPLQTKIYVLLLETIKKWNFFHVLTATYIFSKVFRTNAVQASILIGRQVQNVHFLYITNRYSSLDIVTWEFSLTLFNTNSNYWTTLSVSRVALLPRYQTKPLIHDSHLNHSYHVFLNWLNFISGWSDVGCEWASGYILVSKLNIDRVLAGFNRKIIHCTRAILVVDTVDFRLRGSLN